MTNMNFLEYLEKSQIHNNMTHIFGQICHNVEYNTASISTQICL